MKGNDKMQATVKLLVPFDSLLESVADLSMEEKRQLLLVLEEQIAQTEEEAWEQSRTFRAEIQEARSAYEVGDSMTIDEYIKRQSKKAE
jgi:hypothetical protein